MPLAADAPVLDAARVNVASADTDAELTYIKGRVCGELDVADCPAFGAAVATLRPGGADRTLDLIGHSTHKQYLLRLRAWTLAADDATRVAFATAAPVLAQHRVARIRLIGCRTARSQAGWATARAIADATGVQVFATTDLVYGEDFDRDGFITRNLRGTHVASPPSERSVGSMLPSRAEVDQVLVLDQLTRSPIAALAPVAWPRLPIGPVEARLLWAFVDRRRAWHLPGLLTEPRLELALTAAGTVVRVVVLFGGELIRVYPPGYPHGLIYVVTRPRLLRWVSALRGRPR